MAKETPDKTRRSESGALSGLVLAGGFGTRIGADKGRLEYVGTPQAEVAWRLLEAVCGEAWVAIRADQRRERPYDVLPTVVDTPGSGGPATGLLSAWSTHAGHTWLVLAVDLPLVGQDDLQALIDNRDERCIATVFVHPDGTPEPLCAIWERSAEALVRHELEAGSGSLRRVLERSDIATVAPPDPARLVSVNDRQAFERASHELAARQSRQAVAQ